MVAEQWSVSCNLAANFTDVEVAARKYVENLCSIFIARAVQVLQWHMS